MVSDYICSMENNYVLFVVNLQSIKTAANLQASVTKQG